MELRPLGRTDLKVSAISLGSMNWGAQNTEEEGHAQLDVAVERGVNFIDSAEMYPTLVSAETQGDSERILGSWLKARSADMRDGLVIASKILGPRADMTWIRNGDHRHDAASIRAAVDGSRDRLGIDVIDVYYIHWPERPTNTFGMWGYKDDPDATFTPILEILEGLQAEIDRGTISHVAVSNETPWGLMEYLKLADQHGLTRPCCIQNTYHLMNRTYEVGLAEISLREDCGLIAYAPQAGGALTGKYLDGAVPAGSRLDLTPERMGRYQTPDGLAAAKAYAELAADLGMSAAQLATAFVMAQPFVTSTLLGAGTVAQLEDSLGACDLTLSTDTLSAINALHTRYPHPCP